MQYSRYFRDNEQQARENGQRDLVSYDEVLHFVGSTQDDMAELLMDILNGVYSVDNCLKDIASYNVPEIPQFKGTQDQLDNLTIKE